VIHTPVCDLLQIRHPIVLAGMAGVTSVPLVAAVSNAGGLGTLAIARTAAEEQIPKDISAIREATKRPFGVNFLVFPGSRARHRCCPQRTSARVLGRLGRIRICGPFSAGRTKRAAR
jgi:NAD(P)H-dependent flavin oxidoreductase YrpB (nitropropane dioxygenase family)